MSQIAFLKKLSNGRKNEEVDNGKGCYGEYCGSPTPKPAKTLKMAAGWGKLQETHLPLDMAQHFFLAEISMLKIS